jgi:tetratricopeptide (TPR) repeat protein
MKFKFVPWLTAALLGAATSLAWGAATAVPPGPDNQVVDVLPQVTTLRPTLRTTLPTATKDQLPKLAQAAQLARAAIETARRTGDARYWGRAQAALGSWWDHPDAPAELMVLQATVQQGQHAFDAAQARLRQALQADPANPQAWLTLATLLRLEGRYREAGDACERVISAGAALYGQACLTEVRSLQGTDVAAAWPALLAQAPQPDVQAWLLSLWGEHLERQGRPNDARQRYQQSLALQADFYTALAQADLLLRQRNPGEALSTLAASPDTDAVLLRRAQAQRLLNLPDWQNLLSDVQARQQALERRGENLTPHAREAALAALWLQDDPALAQRWAARNLTLQQEPIDWWLALESAQRAGDRPAFTRWRAQIDQIGLTDARLPKVWTHAR